MRDLKYLELGYATTVFLTKLDNGNFQLLHHNGGNDARAYDSTEYPTLRAALKDFRQYKSGRAFQEFKRTGSAWELSEVKTGREEYEHWLKESA